MNKKGFSANFLITLVLGNGIVLLFASMLFPVSVVLGNALVPGLLAMAITAVLLTIIFMLVPMVLEMMKLKIKSSIQMNLAYGLVNIIAVWTLAKFAHYLGFGISSFWVATILGVFLTLGQYLLWISLAKKK